LSREVGFVGGRDELGPVAATSSAPFQGLFKKLVPQRS
jgi:hypothetical protein